MFEDELSVGCKRLIIKGGKSQSSCAAVQTSNHEFEEKKGLRADLCQKVGMGALLEDAMAVSRCTNQIQHDSDRVTHGGTLRFSKMVRMRARINK